ncbi:MAG: NAD(P)/FAD-dependent oxidoreductase [Hyphomonadaceae bacterium]
MTFDAIVIGGGAAGLFCAAVAGARGRRVLVLEANRDIGAKILISGGGRCNFTNLHAEPSRFISANPDFARSALARFQPADFIALIERHGIAYHEKTLGQLFCTAQGGARDIVAMLRAECAAAGVAIRAGVAVQDVSFGEGFTVMTDAGMFRSPALVLAAGGVSIPKIGASDFALRAAKRFGLAVIPPQPGLAPLTFGADDLAWMRALAGVSADVTASAGGAHFREALLFTHRGLSGPAILQVSSYWRAGDAVTIDWAPDAEEDFLIRAKAEHPRAHAAAAIPGSRRLAEALAGMATPSGPLADIRDRVLLEAGRKLKAWRVLPAGTEGFAKAEVMVGGVDTRELSQRTMEARRAPGLYVIGEAVDVTGWLGGYNFQWAWASAHAAGSAL